MVLIAASLRGLATVAARQSSSPPCQSAARVSATPRLFSSFQLLRDQLGADSQVEVGEQVPQVTERVARREPLEGDLDYHEADWQFDDISSMGHAELERHREARKYARIIAYEMPQLSALARPFVFPNEKEVLRFRYTTYMGEKHPAESKVVCEFAPLDLPLTREERRKLKKLVGVRYNPDTGLVRMSSEMFEHQAQNKRYLSDLVDALVTEAKDTADTFDDIPLDFRHHEAKKAPRKPKFPVEWRWNPERRAQLEEEKANLKKMFEQ